MKKIVLLSDIHGHREVLSRIDALYPAADYYLHCGDSLMDADDLRPFASVKGNCDRADFPLYRELEIEGHNIFMCHGHTLGNADLNAMSNAAKAKGCDLVFFGHLHLFIDKTGNGVRLINPGSAASNHDGSRPCFAYIEITQDVVNVKRIDL